MILKRMKRRHLRADTLEFVAKVRALRPDVVFGADIIAGFPDRDRRDVRELAQDRRRGGPDLPPRLPVFAARRHAGGPHAAGQPRRVAKARAAQLRASAISNIASSAQPASARSKRVLVERDGLGRTEQFVPIAVPGHGPGEIVAVRVTGTSAGRLVGEPIRTAA